MTTPPIVHGSFTIERSYRAPVARVFAAWSDIETKARWFIGPPDKWKLVERALDFRVGGHERLHGQLIGGPATIFTAHYHAIAPDQRLVYAYDMHVGEKHLSVSLASVEFSAAKGGGTRMTFTEQAAFLDGEDGTKSRESGTDEHFDRLAQVLDDPHEIISTRLFDAPRERVFAAFSEPLQLAQWWGPKGFRNTFHAFDLRPGGAWRFVMHAPDGTDYVMAKEFNAVEPPGRVAFQHLDPTHRFEMTITLSDLGKDTHACWRMRFESEREAEASRAVIAEANEQNFDRLAAHLAQAGGARR
jgi:uncharacterized protein YndB with AHSA1/START domain